MKRIYVTFYDLKTKLCTSQSICMGVISLEDAAGPHYTHANNLISKSKRLILIDVGELGIAFSDYVIREDPVPCS